MEDDGSEQYLHAGVKRTLSLSNGFAHSSVKMPEIINLKHNFRSYHCIAFSKRQRMGNEQAKKQNHNHNEKKKHANVKQRKATKKIPEM